MRDGCATVPGDTLPLYQASRALNSAATGAGNARAITLPGPSSSSRPIQPKNPPAARLSTSISASASAPLPRLPWLPWHSAPPARRARHIAASPRGLSGLIQHAAICISGVSHSRLCSRESVIKYDGGSSVCTMCAHSAPAPSPNCTHMTISDDGELCPMCAPHTEPLLLDPEQPTRRAVVGGAGVR